MRITNDNYITYSEINFKNVYLDNGRILTEKRLTENFAEYQGAQQLQKLQILSECL